MATPTLASYWASCVDTVKDRVNNRSLWAALEVTSAITLEDGVLVIGHSAEDTGTASAIQHPSTLHAVTNIAQQIFGQKLQLKLIEGATPDDWAAYKAAEAHAAELRKTVLAPKTTPMESTAASGSWEAVYEQMSRLFSGMPYRALPQGKARFANEALYILMDAMDALYTDPPDDHTERSLARVLERIANASEIPASVLAFELERLRAWRSTSTQTN